MQKINFVDLPSTTTPLNATNMNALQTNVENVFNGTVPAGNMVVDSIRSKNMFDSKTIVQGNITGEYSTMRMSSRQAIWLDAGTYTFSTNMTNTYNNGLVVQSVGVPPLASYPTYSYDSGWQTATTKTFTISTPGYFCLQLRKNDDTAFSNTDITNLKGFNYQLEKGNTATSFAPFQNLTSQENYSTGEIKIGTWIDGKDLYRRCFNIPTTTISSSSATAISISVGNVNVVDVRGYVYVGTSKYRYSINGMRTFDYGWRYDEVNHGMQLIVATSLAPEGTINGVAIVEYTKSSD